MRVTPLTIALAVGALSLSSSGMGQERARTITPQSLEWTQTGDAALAGGQAAAATDAYETAAALDPANGRAFVGMGAAARAEGLPGKAIRSYREALMLDARDTAALTGIGVAFAEKGAVDQARAALASLDEVCGTDCPGRPELVAALEKGTVTAAAVEAKPVVEQAN